MAENEKKPETLTDEQLDEVSGGSREQFNEICELLGKNPTFSTRNGIRKYLQEHCGIGVAHWNTGDRMSSGTGDAEFVDLYGQWYKPGTSISYKNVYQIIKNGAYREGIGTQGYAEHWEPT